MTVPGTVRKPTNSMVRKSQFTDLTFKKGKYDFFLKDVKIRVHSRMKVAGPATCALVTRSSVIRP